MRKKLFLFITFLMCSNTIGCSFNSSLISSNNFNNSGSSSLNESNDQSHNDYKYPEYMDYYDVPTKHGLIIICWQVQPNKWKCGLVPAGIFYSLEMIHIQYCIPCDLDIMRDILKTYEENVVQKILIGEVNFPNPNGIYRGSITHENDDYLRGALGIPSSNNSSNEANRYASSYCRTDEHLQEDQNSENLPYEYLPGNLGTIAESVICWQTEPNSWRCGLFNYSHGNQGRRELEFRHMQRCIPCTLSEMKEILQLYSEDMRDPWLGVGEIQYPYDEKSPIIGSENVEFLKNELGLV